MKSTPLDSEALSAPSGFDRLAEISQSGAQSEVRVKKWPRKFRLLFLFSSAAAIWIAIIQVALFIA